MIYNGFELTIYVNEDLLWGIILRINKSKEFRKIREYISLFSSWTIVSRVVRVLNEKTQGINLETEYTMNYNEICGFTPHFGRQHRDFIKIMIKYEDFKQYWIQPNQSFFPNQTPNDKSNSGPERGKPKPQPYLSIHPQKVKKGRQHWCLDHTPMT